MTEVTPHPLKTQGFHHFFILLFYDHPAKGGLFGIFMDASARGGLFHQLLIDRAHGGLGDGG